jgi:NAD(P)-dependent dehydrogenase (short-subunit alcohol dehydrogenase family)
LISWATIGRVSGPGAAGEVAPLTPTAEAFDGAVALVTGGGRGLGFEIAKTLAGDGATVCLTGRDPESLLTAATEIRSLGGHVELFAGDVTDSDAMASAVEHFRRTAGSVSILVNNAGIGIGGPVSEADPDAWWRVMEVNVKGPMLMSRLVLPEMLDRGHGHIINMGSYQAIAPAPMSSSYATSKAALLRFTDSLSAEVIDRGVIVTAVSPGWVVTDMTREVGQMMRSMNPDWEGVDPEYVFEAGAVCNLIREIVTGKTARLHGRLLHVKDDLGELLDHADEIIDRDGLAMRFNFFEA